MSQVRQWGRKKEEVPPYSTFCSIYALNGLNDAHLHWEGSYFTASTTSRANLILHPETTAQTHPEGRFNLGTPQPVKFTHKSNHHISQGSWNFIILFLRMRELGILSLNCHQLRAASRNAKSPVLLTLYTLESWRRKWQPTPVFLAWKIPRTEEPGGLQSMGSQRIRHDWAPTRMFLLVCILYSR